MSPVTDRTPALAELADLEPEGWTEPEIEAWANEIAEDEWRDAQLDAAREAAWAAEPGSEDTTSEGETTMAYVKRALEEHTAAAVLYLLPEGICRTCGFIHPETDCPRWPEAA